MIVVDECMEWNDLNGIGMGAKVQPGCEIVVPAKLKRKMSAAEMMSMGSSMSSIAAMIATISNIITK